MSRSESKKNTAPLKMALAACIIAALSMALYYFDEHYVVYDGNIYQVGSTSLDLRGTQDIDLERIYRMKSLEFIDLRDSALTVEQADELHARLPECYLLWSVPIAGQRVRSDAAELELDAPTEQDFELLRCFDGLEKLTITNCDRYDTIMAYESVMTDCEFSWTVPICGKDCKSTTPKLALPDASAQDFELLRYLTVLETVDFTGCTEYESILAFAESRPECKVSWTVDFFGTELTSEDTEVDISGITVEDTAELERLIGWLPKLEKIVMCDCGLSNETLDELNRKYENVRIIWRVYFGWWSLRTDATVFSTQNGDPPAYRLRDEEVTVLRYCTDLEMLDLGHNSLTSVEPFENLTNLKVLILADNRIEDISTLDKLTKMEYIEMFINRIEDISVLRNMPNLTDVNFCWNYITDPSPLYDHQYLERVWMCGGYMSAATKREFKAALPGVEFDLYSTYGSTNGSWRYNDHFAKIRDGFRNHNGLSDYHW